MRMTREYREQCVRGLEGAMIVYGRAADRAERENGPTAPGLRAVANCAEERMELHKRELEKLPPGACGGKSRRV